ncbi:MAG: YxeA family protein [Lactobacillaceae bacterium]|jgi:uncharacterized protein (TIGR01655 family)|nr:YxeA family protein [Lactobacillaceae bacterium]
MKKFVILGIFIVTVLAAFGFYQYNYGGTMYYVTTTKPTSQDSSEYQGQTEQEYSYATKGYDQDGKAENIEYTSYKSNNHPLKLGYYLKLKVSRVKGVISYEAIPKSEVPKKALTKLAQ